MITNFEDITYDLTIDELKLVPYFVVLFRLFKDKPLTNTEIIHKIYQKTEAVKLTGVRVRKIINYIRVNQIVLNLVANSRGYYISTSEIEVGEYMLSLQQRIEAIQAVLNSFKKST